MTGLLARTETLLAGSGDGTLGAGHIAELTATNPIGEVMLALVEAAARRAQPAVSGYKVGAVGQGSSGALYLGANIEFSGATLQQTVHAEQCVVANAAAHGETGLTRLAVTAPPCGHCRQFLYELTTADGLEIWLPEGSGSKLTDYLPDAFGPKDLGMDGGLLGPQNHGLSLDASGGDDLATAAVAAANASYAPYTQAFGGAAIAVGSCAVFSGSYLENVAFNPSLPPFQTAYVGAMLAGHRASDVVRVAVAQPDDSHVDHHAVTETLLANVAPSAELSLITLPRSAN